MPFRNGTRFIPAALLTVAAAACTLDTRGSSGDSTAALAGGPRRPLAVVADISTKAAMLKIESAYERGHNVDLAVTFGESDSLAKQMMAAGGADVFLSVDTIAITRLDSAGLVVTDTYRKIFYNQLAIVESWDSASVFTTPFDPAQLADTNLRQLALADPARSSAGRYSRMWLEQARLWDTLSARIRPASDIAAALAATEQGQAQAAIVYRTEVMGSPKFRTLYTIPGDQGILIPYSVAVIARRPSEEDARIFADYLTSPVARQIFEVMGFIVPRVAPP